jgi:arsenite methyltransferase
MPDYLQSNYNIEDPGLVSIIDDLPFWSAPFGIRLLDMVNYKKNIRALDIGFGFGFPLVELAMRLGASSKVYGIDPGKAGIDRTFLKLKIAGVENVELVQGHAEKMPFEDHLFDLIVSNNGINNVSDVSGTFSECNRVSKIGAQFVFTYNTDKTFIEFYDMFRQVLRELGLGEFEKNIDLHISSKRKPLSEFKKLLVGSGFKIRRVYRDKFRYKFSDGTAMLNHFFMNLAFLPPWKGIVPEPLLNKVFGAIEEKINRRATDRGGFQMTVPFVTIDCRNVRGL